MGDHLRHNEHFQHQRIAHRFSPRLRSSSCAISRCSLSFRISSSDLFCANIAFSSALSLAACSSANCCSSLVVASFSFDSTYKTISLFEINGNKVVTNELVAQLVVAGGICQWLESPSNHLSPSHSQVLGTPI